ncbi:MAG: helix-turn-helix transcriptional regulator [Alcaligenaceae bacterium]|nr:helix-turn-helix transcriptional regulator [Alcaligenaceae bacterium]
MTGKFFHSDHLVWLVNQDQAHEFLKGQYLFRKLNSGLSIHGGTICPSKSLKSGRLINRYVNLIVLLEGDLRFSINEHRYDIEAGEHGKLILITPDNSSLFTRYLVNGERSIKIAIKGIERWIDGDTKDKYPSLYQRPVRIRELDSEQRGLSLNFLQQIMDPSPNSLMLDYSALKLLDQLWANFADDCAEDGETLQVNPDTEFVEQLIMAYQPRLSAQELADCLHLRERTLQRRIKNHFGCTLRDWMHRQKMIQALQLLVQNQLSISEVSYECGYKHVSNFTQAFKQYFDSTPAEIQRSNAPKVQFN